jgi:hypothetical protein
MHINPVAPDSQRKTLWKASALVAAIFVLKAAREKSAATVA